MIEQRFQNVWDALMILATGAGLAVERHVVKTAA